MKHNEKNSQETEEHLMVAHTTLNENQKQHEQHRVTIVANIDSYNNVTLGFSICYPTDNFEKNYGRSNAYGKTKKTNYFSKNGVLKSQPSFLSYAFSKSHLKKLNIIDQNEELNKKVLRRVMNDIGDDIVKMLYFKQPIKAYPTIQGTCDNKIVNSYTRKETV